jgi:hypothetical protein
MKRGEGQKEVIVKATGKKYDVHSIVKRNEPSAYREGTIVVKNPLYNPEAAQQWLYFDPKEVEITEKEKNTMAYFEQQKARQGMSGSQSQERN